MKMNKIALACGAALMGATAVAQAELSANIGATSNYMFRGISLTGDDAAVSGGLDYDFGNGFAIGTWASSLNPGTEVDVYGSFSGEMGGIGYSLGATLYTYPEDTSFNYGEISASVSFSMFEAGIAYTPYSKSGNDGAQFDEGDLYYWAGASTDIMDGFSLGLTAGYYDWDNDGAAGVKSYGHVDLTISKDVGDLGEFSFLVSKAGKGADVLGGAVDDDINFAVSWAKSF